jgi:hypothetical protein
MKRNNEEHLIQCGIVDWYNLIIGDDLLIAIPNGGARNAATGAMLKREGVRPGVWDLFLPVPCGGQHGLWTEVKVPSKRHRARGGLTEKQEAFGKKMRELGYATSVVYTTQDGIGSIRWYLMPRNPLHISQHR